MAVTLTASASLNIQDRVQRMWAADQTQALRQYDNPVVTAQRVFERQTMRFMPVMDDTGKCVSWKIWRPDLEDIQAQSLYSSTTPQSNDCDLPTGATVGTTSVTYAPNLYIVDKFQLSDDLCANDATFVELSSVALSNVMLKMRAEINKQTILFLSTNATANVDTAISGNAANGFTIDGAETIISNDAFNDASVLMKMQITAASNRIPQYLILDGTNLLLNSTLAPYLGQNIDNRSTGALYADFAARYSSDLYDMDRIVAKNATFLANPNMIGYFNRAKYDTVAQMIDSSKNLMAFKIADPFLTYSRTEVNASGVVTARVNAPVEYTVLYQRTCTSSDANGYPYFMHKWQVFHEGGLLVGPKSDSDATGILKFVRETGS